MGPGPPPKRGNKQRDKTGSRRELNISGQGSSAGGSSADTTIVAEGDEGSEARQGSVHGEGWNKRRYQRPDEVLWGVDTEQYGSMGSSIELSRMSRSGTADSGPYYVARNPAVNDLHPPIVSTQPTHRREIKWMLQPPPSAKVMEGKEKANRSRSGSGGSYGSSKRGQDTLSLGRQVGERIIEEKVRRGEQLPTAESLSSRKRDCTKTVQTASASETQGQRHDRDPRDPGLVDAAQRKTHVPPNTISEDTTGDFTLTQPKDLRPPQCPPVGKIQSSSQAILTKSTIQPPHSPRSLRLPLSPTPSASSLQVLQELVAPNSTFNIIRSPSPSKEASVKLPPANKREEDELRLPVLESWFPHMGKGSEWNFPATERMRRGDMAGRWSMDI